MYYLKNKTVKRENGSMTNLINTVGDHIKKRNITTI